MPRKHDGGWKRTASRYLYEGKWFNLRQDQVRIPSGRDITYTILEHPGFVTIVPLMEDGTVVLESIYRYTVQETLIECPAGGLDGDTPEAAALRELREETGLVAGALTPLGSYFAATGSSDEAFHVFLATNLVDTGVTEREDTEQMELVRMPLAEAVGLALSGGITDGPSALALLRAQAHLSSVNL